MSGPRIGSLFSGVGAMDLGVERVLGGRTVWFCERDQHARRVLTRHWPGVPVHDDVRAIRAGTVDPIDVLIGGPPCGDLSTAGKRAGLHAERSGLFFELVRIAGELAPELVVVENVPALLWDWRGPVEDALGGVGYGVTWALVRACDVGLPHRRLRVVVIGQRGGRHRGVVELTGADAPGWWPTPLAAPGQQGDYPAMRRRASPPLATMVAAVAVRLWPTIRTYANADHPAERRRNSASIASAVASNAVWTMRPEDDEAIAPADPRNPANATGAILAPDWAEVLQGLPVGWTRAEGPSLRGAVQWPPPAPALPGEAPHPWEPPRTAPRCPDTMPRLRCIGNLVPPQQIALGLARALEGPRQITLPLDDPRPAPAQLVGSGLAPPDHPLPPGGGDRDPSVRQPLDPRGRITDDDHPRRGR